VSPHAKEWLPARVSGVAVIDPIGLVASNIREDVVSAPGRALPRRASADPRTRNRLHPIRGYGALDEALVIALDWRYWTSEEGALSSAPLGTKARSRSAKVIAGIGSTVSRTLGRTIDYYLLLGVEPTAQVEETGAVFSGPLRRAEYDKRLAQGTTKGWPFG
jgi:hypothetical protein